MAQSKRSNGTLKSVQTAVLVLEMLKEHDGMRVSELADELSMAKSTVHRYLKTLTQEEYLTHDGDTYDVSLRPLSLGVHARNRQEGFHLIQEKVDQLAEETGERAQYMVAEHGKAVYLCQSMGRRAVKIDLQVGDRVPLHLISPGKAILAEWPDSRVRKYIETYGLSESTPQSITDPDGLFDELEKVRERGYSYHHEEYIEEFNAVGIALKNPVGRVLGAIGVSGPNHRLIGSRLEEDIPELLKGTAHEIELNLKYSQ